MKAVALILLVTGSCISTSIAATDTLVDAVGFALTGTDDAKPLVIDRPNCVFGLGDEIFHLNNVETDRITIESYDQRSALGIDRYLRVGLHGRDTIYESTTQLQYDPSNELYRALKEKDASMFEPKHSSSNQHLLNLPSSEKGRMVRAWRYIYSNGCVGKKSTF